MGAWYIRITGKRREDVELRLIVQAVIAFGEQLRQEAAAKPSVKRQMAAESQSTTEDSP